MPEATESSLGLWGGYAHPLVTDAIVDGMVSLRMPQGGPTTVFSPASVYVTAIVIMSEGTVAVVDTGFEYQIDRYLVPFLVSRGWAASDVKMVVNSHDHFDHVDGNRRLRELSSVVVAAHESCIAAIPGGVDRPLRDGDEISVGSFRFTVVSLPGHCASAIGLYETRTGVLLSGDSLCGEGGPDVGLVILNDIDAYKASIDRALALRPAAMVPAHPFRGMRAPVLRGPEVGEYLEVCRRAVDRYEAEATRVLSEATESISRRELHEALVESLTLDAEELKKFYLGFLSGYSRATVDALLARSVPPELRKRVSDEPWLDTGQVYGTGE